MTIESDQQLVRDYYPRCVWPHYYYGVVATLAHNIRAKTIVEIGVAYGYHAADILDRLPYCRYVGVDPYAAGYDETDSFCNEVAALFNEPNAQKAMDRLYAVVSRNLASFNGRAALHRLNGANGAALFPDGQVDVIFIDGDHRYEAVKNDIASWWPKLRSGGILCGDDYDWLGVKTAADEFSSSVGIKLGFVGKPGTGHAIWLLRKPDF